MAEHSGRIVILSDTHLGKPRGGALSVEALRPLWQGADRLIINGDVAEVNDATLRADAAREVLKIERYCEADGVELTLVSGNHDPLITDLRSLTLHGGEVYLTHGDVLHPAISPWTGHRNRLRFLNQRTHEALPPDERGSTHGDQAATQYAAHFTWEELTRHDVDQPQSPPRRLASSIVKLARVFWYWQTLPRAAARYAERHAPGARFFIFGHIHRSGVWRFGRRVVINTGAYGFPFRPHAVVIDAGQLSVWPVVLGDDKSRYGFAGKPVAAFELNSLTRAAA